MRRCSVKVAAFCEILSSLGGARLLGGADGGMSEARAEEANSAERWVDAFALDELDVGAVKAFVVEQHRVLVARVTKDKLYAIDERCPRGGHALVEAALDGSVLACAYQDFRFDFATGKAVR